MNRLFIPLLLAWCLIACRDEDVLPRPPATKSIATSADTSKVVSPSAESPASKLLFKDSAFYQFSNFQTLPYRILTPRKFDSRSRYPLVIFLHGIDERGTDNERQLKWGASMFLADSATLKYPSFVVFPQCPTAHKWVDDGVQVPLRGMIDNLLATLNVDPSRIYIMGLSMGGYGTYATVAANPGLFAAAIAISGDGDENKSSAMARTNWKIFGGKKDQIVSSEKSEKMAKALKQSGAQVSLTIYPDADHVHSWTKAFAEPDFLSWLYANKK